MTNLSISSNQLSPSAPVRFTLPKWLLVVILVVSFIGFFDAAFLTLQYYHQGIIPCVVFKGCDQVLTSQYAVIKGIPISLLGAIYYLVIFISGVLFLDTKNRKALLIISLLPTAGFATSLVLIYLQIFIIKAICTYCVVSAISSTILFILGLQILERNNEDFCQN